MRKLVLFPFLMLFLSSCAGVSYREVNSWPEARLAALTDDQICEASAQYGLLQNSIFFQDSVPISPSFSAEFKRRGVVCGTVGLQTKAIGNTPVKLADQDDASCQAIGARPGTDAYVACRLQYRRERENAALRAQSSKTQQDASWDSMIAVGAGMMAQPQAAPAAATRTVDCDSTRGSQGRTVVSCW